SLSRATNTAATVGRLFGWGLIAFGVFQLLSGNFLGGLWIAFIGWFLSSAADASRQEMTMRGYLSGVKVRDVMDPNPETIEPTMPVGQMVEDVFRRHRRRAVPVKHDGQLVGIVTVTDVKDLPRDTWGETQVRDIMTREPLYTVGPDDDLTSAMKLITQHDINQVLVLEKGELAGFLSRAEILRHIQFTQELGTAR
ncbi:MAG: CBS domain-containing protein, partial [Chloroflexota bacterium]